MGHTRVIVFLLALFATQCLSKPVEEFTENSIQGRGFGSTLWDWITYPFTWWSSEPEQPPNSEHLTASTTKGPYEDIEVGKRNVTVWCNEQTCTTMRCDRNGCHNITCNIYDTDLMGECRLYNTVTSSPVDITTKDTKVSSTEVTQQITKGTTTITTAKAPETSTVEVAIQPTNQPIVDKPLALEAAISHTVTEQNKIESPDKKPVNRKS